MNVESLSDIKLVGRAVRERWPIDPRLRSVLVAQLTEIAAGKGTKRERDRIAASKVLIDLINTQDDADYRQEADEQQLKLELLRIARSLPPDELAGIVEREGSVSVVEGRADGGSSSRSELSGAEGD